MAVDKGEAIEAAFELLDGLGAPIVDAAPTITFFYPDGTIMVARSGVAVVRVAGTYTAWANTDRGGIHSAVLTASGAGGRIIREEVYVVVVDRAEERLIQGH